MKFSILFCLFFPSYPLENYEFQKKNDHVKNDPSIPTSFLRLKREFYLFGMRRSVQAVLLCHHHNTIHVLLLEESSANFILPGGDLGPDESEEDGLKRYLFTVNIKYPFLVFRAFLLLRKENCTEK